MPDPTVLRSGGAPSIDYRGVRYYRSEQGYYRSAPPGGRRLHRDVWNDHHGNIPHGWEIHHKDDDRSNNEIANLECLPPSEHRKVTSAFTCDVCGKRYEAPRRGTNKYCSKRCKNWRFRHG